MKNGTSSSLV